MTPVSAMVHRDEPIVARDRTLLIGLIGAAIGLSRAPVLHQSEAAAHGLTGIYRLIDLDALGLGPDDLPGLLTAAERFGFAGLNITYPCKQAVIAHLTELSPHAEALGAVNTVVLRDGRRIGHNTDWSGYAESFRAGLPGASLDRVTQFGTGGAGSAVAYALLMLGVRRLALVDTDPARAAALAGQLGSRFGAERVHLAEDAEASVRTADGIVNTTPVGMAKFPGTPFPARWLAARQWVSEIVYFPLETELLAEARRRGCRTLDGSGMNVHQAAEAFALFTGLRADAARMRRVFDAAGGGDA